MSRRGFPVGDGTFTTHRQARVTIGDCAADVDERLAPLIAEIWSAGWLTSRSCQHHAPSGKVWIEFDDAQDAADFTAVVRHGDASFARRMEWCFASFRRRSEPQSDDVSESQLPGAWEFHTQICELVDQNDEPTGRLTIAISVLFPKRDLRIAVERMKAFNAIQVVRGQ